MLFKSQIIFLSSDYDHDDLLYGRLCDHALRSFPLNPSGNQSKEEEWWISLETEIESKTGLPFEQFRVNYG